MIELTYPSHLAKIGDEDVLLELDNYLEAHYSGRPKIILCDSNTLEFCLTKIDWLELVQLKDAEVLEVDPGEGSKSIEVYQQLVQTMLELEYDKHTLLINLGGGVVTDLGGFIGSTFKRGIDFIHVPTTLLAMVDASLGGKTGINLKSGKNQLGTITQPKAIFVSTVFLETLEESEHMSGLGEMVKHLLISDKNALDRIPRLESSITEKEILESLQVKAYFVSEDVFEKGIRKALNFGHTFGHAIESSLLTAGNPIPHGVAVAMGMIMESKLSAELGLLKQNDYLLLDKLLHKVFNLLEHFNALTKASLLKYLTMDKKNKNGLVSFSLIGPIGNYHIDVQPSEAEIVQVIDAFVK